MPSYPEGSMNLNSGVGDNAAGRYFAGNNRGGGSMFRNSRQMKQYMQMRRDEMSHGAFLANQNSALDFGRQQTGEVDKFNRESSRIDATVQQQDWSRGRASEHLTGFGEKNPHATSADLDNAKASWNPGFAPAKSAPAGDGPKSGPVFVGMPLPHVGAAPGTVTRGEGGRMAPNPAYGDWKGRREKFNATTRSNVGNPHVVQTDEIKGLNVPRQFGGTAPAAPTTPIK